jgi:hypothetical protein
MNYRTLGILPLLMIMLNPAHAKTIKPAILLKTRWSQKNHYARFTPGHKRLGCWSVALGQILYFHRLKPMGEVHYKTSAGHTLEEKLDFPYSFNQFVPSLQESTPEISKKAVAEYLYFVSLVIQKDFGTGSYRLNHSERMEALEKHYPVRTKIYKNGKFSREQMKGIIRNELNNRRPVFLHLRNKEKTRFHAVAIDSFVSYNNRFRVHLNMGYGGHSNGWFDFDDPILEYDDTSYRRIITIYPLEQ